jgi:hypothetical protein
MKGCRTCIEKLSYIEKGDSEKEGEKIYHYTVL